MELLDPSRSVLVVIDVQGKLARMVQRPEMVVRGATRLLRTAGLFGVPAILTEQYPAGLGPTDDDVLRAYEDLAGPKARLAKTAFGCCGDPAFEAALEALRPRGIAPRQVVVAGIEAHVCVMQTVLPLLAAGAEVHVCWDAVSARGEEYRRHALERMAAAGAVITNHESVGFEWARHKDHPRFKAFSALVKDGPIA